MHGGRFRRAARLGGLAAQVASGTVSAVATGLSRGRKAAEQRFHEKTAQRLLATLGQMKGLPMKVGQIFSYMDGVMPPEYEGIYRELLARLQVKADPVPWTIMEPEIEAALGAPASEIFRSIDPEPIAAASIGQVYRGVWTDGRAVAIKIQYPGIGRALQSDLENAKSIVATMQRILPNIETRKMAEDMIGRFAEEVDYEHEGASQQEFARLWADDSRVVIPEVILARPRLLVSALARGESFAELAHAPDQRARDAAGEILFWFAFRSILGLGLFNADPHPGNYLFPEPGRVVFLDFGCVQRYDSVATASLRELRDGALAELTGPDLWAVIHRTLMMEGEPDPWIQDLLGDYLAFCFRPVTAPQPFRFTKAYTAEISELGLRAKMKMARHIFKTRWHEPKLDGAGHFVRIIFGLYSLLAEIEAEGDWRALISAV